MNIQSLLIACAALTGAPHAAAQAANPSTTQPAAGQYLVTPSGKLIGLELATRSDKDVGEIGDLLIDPRSGEIRYAVVGVGGFLGIGEDDRVVPWSRIQILRDPQDPQEIRASTELTEQQVEAAPECKSDQVPGADLEARIEQAFGHDDAWAKAGEAPKAYVRLSQLDGAKVLGASGGEIGEIDEIVLAPLSGCIAFVVLDGNDEVGDKDVAIPFARLSVARAGAGGLSITTKVENARLREAPAYDEEQWQRVSSTAWMTDLSKHYECEPFWKTTRFASAPRAKPEQQ
jgi:sporulation protein YlmC with PRC-barrel domain